MKDTEDMNYNYGNANDFRYSCSTQFSDSFQKIFSEIFENEAENLTQDVQVVLSLSFSEAAQGCTKHLSFDADVHVILAESCRACEASGVVEAIEDVKVTTPAGVDSGDTIRVPKTGHAGRRGMQPDTLFIKLKVSKDHLFAREGADLCVDYHISFTKAILGGKVEVPTLSGKTKIQSFNDCER